MLLSIKHIAATINAMTKLVDMLDKRPFGAVMLIVVMVVADGLIVVSRIAPVAL